MKQLVIDVPANEWLSANDRRHWADKARRTKALRHRAAMLARQARLTVATPCIVVAEICYPRGGRADPANASDAVKPILDGLTDASVWVDDDSEHVPAVTYRRGSKTDQQGWHRITLTFIPQTIPF
ncbi:hypothetical protein M3B11_02800 [Brevibacterium sp. p3-SID960]|uniref:hypothetical protein n=1 Tax=Brevibacterium sp. p3-SID960 TaxID=2916063 RepID=UPI0021A74EF4|nr:hypothetical protein [Brevibacterium sp. p3-SID960]MCT1689897.1 hypothetical protein [Brevibacterium sp. p3-SID960]